jgi:threonine dehydrogenase-like Zn-dependent dehydrogenase
VTLVSPGTEVNGYFEEEHPEPKLGGYAAIVEVTAAGEAVEDVRVGQRIFCMGQHQSWQRFRRTDVVVVPAELKPEVAAFCRLMGVSWATLITTAARPADRVLVTGLGLVGNLAGQIFQSAGYRVTAVDPVEGRRKLASAVGLRDVRASAAGEQDLVNKIALAVECSGHEQAVLDCCRIVRKRGEVSMVGAPWKQRADVTAFEVLKEVFFRYVVLRSGWEWELPMRPVEFREGSIFGDYASALDWLVKGWVKTDGLYRVSPPTNPQEVYEKMGRQEGEYLSVVFDWRGVK